MSTLEEKMAELKELGAERAVEQLPSTLRTIQSALVVSMDAQVRVEKLVEERTRGLADVPGIVRSLEERGRADGEKLDRVVSDVAEMKGAVKALIDHFKIEIPIEE